MFHGFSFFARLFVFVFIIIIIIIFFLGGGGGCFARIKFFQVLKKLVQRSLGYLSMQTVFDSKLWMFLLTDSQP